MAGRLVLQKEILGMEEKRENRVRELLVHDDGERAVEIVVEFIGNSYV